MVTPHIFFLDSFNPDPAVQQHMRTASLNPSEILAYFAFPSFIYIVNAMKGSGILSCVLSDAFVDVECN